MEWISVKDELPKWGEVVLLHERYPPGTMFKALAYPLKRNFIFVGGWYDGKFISYEHQFDSELKYVTHWMPLPSRPEE